MMNTSTFDNVHNPNAPTVGGARLSANVSSYWPGESTYGQTIQSPEPTKIVHEEQTTEQNAIEVLRQLTEKSMTVLKSEEATGIQKATVVAEFLLQVSCMGAKKMGALMCTAYEKAQPHLSEFVQQLPSADQVEDQMTAMGMPRSLADLMTCRDLRHALAEDKSNELVEDYTNVQHYGQNQNQFQEEVFKGYQIPNTSQPGPRIGSKLMQNSQPTANGFM